MSIRTVEIQPTGQIELNGELYPVVTLEDLTNALMRAAVVLDMNGGCLSVVQRRIPTSVPDESVTTQALMTWADRTNAKAQREPDARNDSPTESGVRPVDDDEPHHDASAGDVFIGPGVENPGDDVGDGLVYAEGDDVSEIPAPLREAVVGG